MTPDIVVLIGGEPIVVPPLRFAGLKRAWPAIDRLRLADSNDIFEQASAGIAIVSAAVFARRPELTAAEIEERIFPLEIAPLVAQLPTLLKASGLLPEKAPGEAPRGKPRKPSSTKTASTI